jgi:thiol-disulfide isomerase/thioredoxin
VVVQPVKVKQVQARRTETKAGRRKNKRWLGLTVANMTEPIPGAPSEARAMIRRAHRGGPAHRAGLRRGDVIVEAAGHPVGRFQDYIAQARLKEIGDSLSLKILREGHHLLVDVALIEQPKNGKTWRRQHFPGSEAFSWEIPSIRPAGKTADTTTSSRPQVLYFWATWCSPCRLTSPAVELLHIDAKGRVDVIAISSEKREVIKTFVAKGGTTYPVAHDSEGLLKLDYEVQSLPTIVWLEGDKVIAWDYGIGGVQRVISALRSDLRI